MTHDGQAFIRIVLLSHLSASCKAVSLARLVKVEIVSPIYGILINTDVGNPNRAIYHGAWEASEFY